MTLTAQDRETMQLADGLTEAQKHAIGHALDSLSVQRARDGLPHIGGDRAATLEAAMIRFLLDGAGAFHFPALPRATLSPDDLRALNEGASRQARSNECAGCVLENALRNPTCAACVGSSNRVSWDEAGG